MRKKLNIFILFFVIIVLGIGAAVYFIQRIPVGYEKTPAVQLFEKEIVAVKVTSDYDKLTVKADEELCGELVTEGVFDILKSIRYSRRDKPSSLESYTGWTEIEVIFSDDTVLFIRPYGDILNLNRKYYYPDVQLHGFAETLYMRIKKDGYRV